MHIEELKEGDSESSEQRVCGDLCEGALVVWDPKKLFIGAGARALFYPTLLYNVVRNKIQSEFRWWDRVDEYVLLGAVPFPTDVVHLKALGVGGVVTLNEPYEILVRSSLYHDHGIEHLLIPTTDYLFAPSHGDICQAVEFIQRNALCGKTTYVHCKAGRGRSTTIVLCYLVKHKQMTPEGAYKYVRSIRPRVQLASSQWQAVKDYYLGLSKADIRTIVVNSGKTAEERDVEELEKSMVVITESDLEGYEENRGWGEKVVSELKVGLWRASWLWVGGHRNSRRGQNVSRSSEVLLLQSNNFISYPSHGLLSAQTRLSLPSCSCHNQGEQEKGYDKAGRRVFLTFVAGSGAMSTALPSLGKTKKQNPYDEKRLLEQNKRIQRENNVPDSFPNFVREGFAVKVVTPDYYVTRDSGLVVWDIAVGEGDYPKDGQQVTFQYIGYNESGRRIDSTYLQGKPAKVRLGTNGLIPGFEEGIKDMKPGGKRRMIIPPELGPPVGPSTFFSSKQFEVFDVELLSIQDCTRRTIGFYSDVVCG